uniref:exodeoxyribonuclease VII large subunit n=1 Tax=Marinimicrobium alkaliphilum TaxID=2202654 RepID=UPI000DB9AD04|nr:exodeoxyribonuclease VII large subunit [Marinimicrobium alkaliphilum]
MITDNTPNPGAERRIFSVSQLNRQVRQLLETHLPLLWVEGEISNLAQPSSGHWYFTLKDDQAQVRCAMFRNRNQQVRFRPGHGQQVLVRARAGLYEGRGEYQLVVEHMEEAGYGALQRAFEALKHSLAEEGLFAPERKRPLPSLPRHVALITSPTGAVIRDMLTVFKRRFPGIPLTVIPVAVQGKEAAPQIVKALTLANAAGLFDAIILARGGGSLEDLWPFNEEMVARAIAASELPVVSAVGHEVDVTIADFVADMRAPTPSAAAELLAPDASEWQARFAHFQHQLGATLQRRLHLERQRVLHLRQRLRHPGERLQQQKQHLDQLELRLSRSMARQLVRQRTRLDNLVARQKPLRPARRLAQLREQLQQLHSRLTRAEQQQRQRKQQRLSEAARLLNTVSPLNTLERGYSITRTPEGAVLTHHDQVKTNQDLVTHLAHGKIYSKVTSVKHD